MKKKIFTAILFTGLSLGTMYSQSANKPKLDNTTSKSKTISLKAEDLDKYLGVYSSKALPLKITITKNNATLIAQATGQSSFPLEATEKDQFKFDQAGIVMEFDAVKNELTLKQGGGIFLFAKDI